VPSAGSGRFSAARALRDAIEAAHREAFEESLPQTAVGPLSTSLPSSAPGEEVFLAATRRASLRDRPGAGGALAVPSVFRYTTAMLTRRTVQDLAHHLLVGYLRHFPVEKGKQRMLSALWRPLSFGNYRRTTSLRDARLWMACDVRGFIQRQIYFFGAYEIDHTTKWVELVSDAKVVFDIGANVGVYSLLAADANPTASVHAFEPTPSTHAALLDNIRLNRLEGRIVANGVALGRERGQAFLNECLGSDGLNDGMNFISRDARPERVTTVDVLTLDDYCAERGIDRIDALKMDVEGGELDVLVGASRLLERRAIGVLCFEVFDWAQRRFGRSAKDLLGLLGDAGYSLYDLQDRRLVPVAAGAVVEGNLFAFAAAPSS
jgi:FkbM family methyltransferase